jgi:hypothetical protein
MPGRDDAPRSYRALAELIGSRVALGVRSVFWDVAILGAALYVGGNEDVVGSVLMARDEDMDEARRRTMRAKADSELHGEVERGLRRCEEYLATQARLPDGS